MPQIRELGGDIFAVTSQNEEAAAAAKETWGIAYSVLSDPQLGVAAALHRRGLPAPNAARSTDLRPQPPLSMPPSGWRTGKSQISEDRGFIVVLGWYGAQDRHL